MSEIPKHLKIVHVVKPQYLYKKCRGCDKIKGIEHYSKSRLVENLMYTHGKCKICRAGENRKYFHKLRDLANKGKEMENQKVDDV